MTGKKLICTIVLLQNWPYADRLNDRYEGFVVDLMQLIGNKIGFDFRLYFSPDGKYGTEYNGHINGMIGEVFRHVSLQFQCCSLNDF